MNKSNKQKKRTFTELYDDIKKSNAKQNEYLMSLMNSLPDGHELKPIISQYNDINKEKLEQFNQQLEIYEYFLGTNLNLSRKVDDLRSENYELRRASIEYSSLAEEAIHEVKQQLVNTMLNELMTRISYFVNKRNVQSNELDIRISDEIIGELESLVHFIKYRTLSEPITLTVLEALRTKMDNRDNY